MGPVEAPADREFRCSVAWAWQASALEYTLRAMSTTPSCQEREAMAAPVVTLRAVVPERWIDINGHMNATHYVLVIYDAHVEFTRSIGLGDDYVARTQCGKAVIESHMVYEREIALGDRIGPAPQAVGLDRVSRGGGKSRVRHELHQVDVAAGVDTARHALDTGLEMLGSEGSLARGGGQHGALDQRQDLRIGLRARRSSPLPEDLRQALRQRVRANLAQIQPGGVGGRMRLPVNTWLDA